MKICCLVCMTCIPFDPSIQEDTIEVIREKNAPWEVMKAALDRRMCKSCREKAESECH